MMHVLNVNFSLDLESGSGTAERTFQLSRHLVRRGVRCSVLTLAIGLDKRRLQALRGVKVVAVPCVWRRFFVPWLSWTVLARMNEMVRNADVVHLTGHWSLLNAVVYFFIRWHRKPYIASPAGLLRQAGRSIWLKRIYNLVVGRRLLRNAAGWIAVTPGEFPDFAFYGIESERVTVLPNGIDPERALRSPTSHAAGSYAALSPYILYVGRIHPVKGPDLLLEAFRTIGAQFPRHRLLFIGPDDGIRSSLEQTARTFPEGERVLFMGYRTGADKEAAYYNADLLVIPSRSEAMSLVVLEAAVVGTPALLTDRCGFDEISSIDPRLIVPATAEAIAQGVCALLEDDNHLKLIGTQLQDYVLQRFAWTVVIDRFIALCHAARDKARSQG